VIISAMVLSLLVYTTHPSRFLLNEDGRPWCRLSGGFSGNIPLMRPAENGHGVMKILFEQENSNPDRPNKRSQSPLMIAAWNRREGAGEMLPRRENTYPDKPDYLGHSRSPRGMEIAEWYR